MKKVNLRIFLVLLLIGSLGLKLSAQSVVAQVSSKQVQVGADFEYAVVANANVTGYAPPAFNGLAVLGGPNTSNSMQWINGQTSVQTTLSWSLRGAKEGKYTIGPTVIMVGAQRFETQPITVEVVKGAPNNQGQSQQSDPKHGTALSGGDLFIRTGVNKTKCYVGEQLVITQKVYCRLQFVGFQKFEQPTYDGFYSQQQESASKGQLSMENVDGVNYYTFELFRTLATANQAGKITLTPVEGDVVVRRQAAKARNIIEQFFGNPGYEDVPVTVKSRPFTVEVMPLPEEGKPESFNGAVGSFTSKLNASRTELKANDAFNLKMTVSGKGNIKLITPPKIELPQGFEAYEPKVSETPNSKTFDYLVIPRTEGDFVIKDIEFSFFNLDTKKYVRQPSEEIKIKVLPADPNSSGGAQVYTPHSQIKETENDIRYIKKGNFDLAKTDTEFFNSTTHLAYLGFTMVALLAGLFIRRNHIKNNSNQVLVRERKAARIARKQLASAEKLMNQNKKDDFYTEILTALYSYLGNKLNIPASELSRESIHKILSARQIEENLLSKLLSTIETGEYAKYAPGAVSGDLKAVYSDTVVLITSLEEQLNKKNA